MIARIFMLSAVAAIATMNVTTAAETAKTETQAEIPFANNGGIHDWRADSDRALYVQGRDRQWYKAGLLSDCMGLWFADNIGFKTEANGSFNRFSSIIVEGRNCPLTSFEKSDPPPPKKDKKAKEAANP